ncbi:MAG: Rrf2 family transcriptional regulator, partial [Flavobacteriales bacterium]|nr:Rrf2 family transcriptional regulator [Flavobacteriales bacterium]
MFSKACEYGIRAMILTAWRSQDGGRVNITEISERIGSPTAFTAKVMQQLVREGLLSSHKGPTGGFSISPDEAKRVRLSQVVGAIDGDSIYRGCGLGLSECSDERPCP